MSVITDDTIQVPIDLVGGLWTLADPQNNPPGASPNCQDCDFLPGVPGSVFTRPGLFNNHQFPGNPTINYARTFRDQQQNLRNLYFDSLQNLWEEFPQGTFNIRGSVYQSTYIKSDTAFGREWLAFSDGKFGTDAPRQWDGVNLDRVSQDGPGTPPTVADLSFALTAISRAAGIISATTVGPHGLAVGTLVNIAGQIDNTLNGQFPVLTVPTPTTFTANGSAAAFVISSIVRAAGIVTATIVGTLPALTNGVSVIAAIGVVDASFNGVFTITNFGGNSIIWTQAGADSTSYGGALYPPPASNTVPIVWARDNYTLAGSSVLGFVFEVPGDANITDFELGASVTIVNNTVGAYNTTVVLSNGRIHQPDGTLGFQSAPIGAGSAVGTGGTATVGLPDSAPTVTGVAGPAGNISAGPHQISVLNVTRQQYLTRPAPSGSWIAAGGFMAVVSGISIGPSNVLQRIVCLTAAYADNFYYIQNPQVIAGTPTPASTVVNDNLTTSIAIDFTDASLIANIGTNVDDLFDNITLGEVAGFMQYAGRMLAWGERAKIDNFLNLSFDGGALFPTVSGMLAAENGATGTYLENGQIPQQAWIGDTIVIGGVNYVVANVIAPVPPFFRYGLILTVPFAGPTGSYPFSLATGADSIPTGWTPTGAVPGALDAVNSVVPGLWGYRITGDGLTLQAGTLQQGAAVDYLNVPIIEPATAYSVRFRLLESAGAVTGTFCIQFSSASAGITKRVLIDSANIGPAQRGIFQEFILPIILAADFQSAVPSDLILSVFVTNTLTNGEYFTVDDIEFFPTLVPYNLPIVRASLGQNPETFLGTTGLMEINDNDDQRVTCLYPIRDTLRIAKEHGLFTTKDNPQSEPDAWNVELISSVVGSASLNSAGGKYGETGKEWAALLCREGVFIDYGQQIPEKLNEEVERSNGLCAFAFDLVNWAYAHSAWITVDTIRRRMLIGLPMGNAQTPSTVAMMEFKAPALGDASVLAQSPVVRMSTFTNKQVALSGARKWSPWSIAANCGGMIERTDGTAHLFLGNGVGNGKVYDLLPGQTTDDGATIPFFFQASFLPDDDRKNIAYRFQGGLVLAKYLRVYAVGSGNLKLTLIGTGGVNQLVLPLATAPAIPLANPSSQDVECFAEFTSERVSILVQATGAGSWINMQKLEMFLEQNPTNALRGSNP